MSGRTSVTLCGCGNAARVLVTTDTHPTARALCRGCLADLYNVRARALAVNPRYPFPALDVREFSSPGALTAAILPPDLCRIDTLLSPRTRAVLRLVKGARV